jgi:DNA-directed RNA polymerase subunit RPC12/RpoP
VSGYEASCPTCGAPVAFSLGSSLLKVCDHCGAAVARKGASLESYGKVAELVPTGTVLRLGLKGGYAGAPGFSLIGRLQLDWGAGTWDEWLMAFANESWAWLSDSQGRYHYLAEAPLPPLPDFSDLRMGQTVDLGPSGTFVVAEKRQARFVAAEGELPFDVPPGTTLNYADLSGAGGQFGTIDYGAGETPAALYVGREVALEEIGLGSVRVEKAARRGEALSLKCPRCGGTLELRAPDETQRVGCPWCGSLLDATRDLAVLQALDAVPVQPLIPLGSRGRLEGVLWTLVGFMERSVTVEGVRYPWGEYLLHEPKRGFRWLVESNGHWSLVTNANAGDVRAGIGGVRFEDRHYKHFQSGRPVVDHVLGEFYWAVARGDRTESLDYTSPPYFLSKESTASEETWSHGRYLEPREVWAAFALKRRPPERRGVGMNQPWPHQEQLRSVLGTAGLMAALVLLLYFVLLFAGGRSVYSASFPIPATAVPGAPESAVFTEPFEVPRGGNLQVKVDAPVNNSWLYLDGALINEQTGGLDEFDAEVSYYHGRDSDGSWSEGGTSARTYVGSVPAGRYVLRLAPQWDASLRPASYSVTVRSRVPRLHHALGAVAAILAWPVLLAWRRFRFEVVRWSESDHPIVSSEDDE